MLIERFTLKAQDSIEKACRLAVKQRHRFVHPTHLLCALLGQDGGPTRKYLSLAGANLEQLNAALKKRLASLPHASEGSQETPISRDLEAVFAEAEDRATQMEDKYIAINHLVMGLFEDKSSVEDLESCGVSRETLDQVLEEVKSGLFRGGEGGLEEFETLSKYCVDLTAVARDGKLDPVIGRDAEVRQVMQVLSRRSKNNPVIIGEPGVGKTAIVEGLAQKLVLGEVPDNLRGHALVSLDLGQVVAGARYRGEFEDRFKKIIQEITGAENLLLFIDEIHMLVGAGGAEGSMDASNLLKPAMARGQLRCIGATTLNEYRKNIEKDAALTRRFQTVLCEEPTVEQSISILRGLKGKYEVHHGVHITDAAICAAARLADRYISDRFLPDKAIDLIDESAASIRMDISSKPEEIAAVDRRAIRLQIELRALEGEKGAEAALRKEEAAAELETAAAESARLTEIWKKEKKALFEVQQAKADLDAARSEMEQKIREEDFARVAELQYKIIPDREKTLAEYADIDISDVHFLHEEVVEEDVAKTVSRWTGIPVTKMLDSERDKLLHMEDILRGRVVGQEDALKAMCKAIRRSRAGLHEPGRPIASFLMLGPTGVGKTELCKAVAEFLFDSEKSMIRFDMSEYMEKQSVARLVGAAPGYVGYEEGGVLTNKVRRHPYSVVLFDEVEKAHPDIFNIQLQMLDDGRLTDSQGKTVDFSNTVIILTSNLGARAISDFRTAEEHEAMVAEVMKAVKGHFRPEFLNRIDETVIFRRLTADTMQPIVRIQLKRLQRLLKERKIELQLTDEALALLASEGFDPEYGARPLRRAILRMLKDPLSEEILGGRVEAGDKVLVAEEDGKLVFSKVEEEVEDGDEAQAEEASQGGE